MIILHIQVSLGTKFQFKLTILDFLTKFAQKGLFLVKNGKITLVCASMIVTYYIKLFGMEVDRHSGILMSLAFQSQRQLQTSSILPNISKIFEQCMFHEISSFMYSYLAKQQCGFRIKVAAPDISCW